MARTQPTRQSIIDQLGRDHQRTDHASSDGSTQPRELTVGCSCGRLSAVPQQGGSDRDELWKQHLLEEADLAIRTAVATAIRSRITRGVGGHPFSDADRGMDRAARLALAARS